MLRFDWDELLLVVCQGGAIRWDRGGRERDRGRIRGAFQTSLDMIRAQGKEDQNHDHHLGEKDVRIGDKLHTPAQ